MTIPATSALAPTFRYTQDASWDVRVRIGGVDRDVTLPTGDYRMFLAPTTGDVVDLLRALQDAVNAVTVPEGATLSLGATDAGVASLNFTGSVDRLRLAAPLARMFGVAVDHDPPVFPIEGAYPMWHLALFSTLTKGLPLPSQAGGAEVDGAGVVYAFFSDAVSHRLAVEAQFVPWDPGTRVAQACDATPLYPELQYIHLYGSTATARAWGVLDVLRAAAGASCGLALNNWRTVRFSTSERHLVAYVAPDTAMQPEPARFDDRTPVWARLPMTFSLPATGVSATRA